MTPSMPPDGFADEQETNGPPDGFADEPMTLEGFKQNAIKGAVGNLEAVGAVGSLLSNYFPLNIPAQIQGAVAGRPFTQPPIERDAKIVGSVARELPGALVEGVTRYADPVKAAYDDPITTAIDAVSLGGLAKPAATLAKGVGTAVKSAPRRLLQSATAKSVETPIGRKFLSATLGPTEEAISARAARPKAILKATNEARIAEELEKGLRTVEGRITDVEGRVGKTLKASPYLSDGATGKDDVLAAIENARKEIGFTVTPDEQFAKGILDNLTENLNRLRNTVSEKQMRDIVQKVSNAIPYGAKEYGTKNIALMRLRSRLDSFLKKNPAYRDLMKEEVPLQRLKTDLIDDFGFKRSVGEGMKATDATASKLTNILKDTKEVRSQRILNRLKNVTGKDYIQDVRDWQVAEQFQPGMTRPNGSRRVNWGATTGAGVGAGVGALGGPVGSMLGGAVGAISGAMAGGYMDKQGGAIAAKLIDMYLRNKGGSVAAKAINPAVEEFAPVLIDAVEKTGLTLEEAAANLSQSNPSFKSFLMEVLQPDESKPRRILRNSKDAAEAPMEETQQEAKILDEDTAREYLKQAGGDKAKARKLALKDGWKLS